jgi:IS5 family transposase
MLGLSVGRVESLFDLGLPVEVRELPDDLAALDELLGDRALLEPIAAAWDAAAREFGRPTVPMDRHVRLMVIEQRTGWGYETLVGEVSDSLHPRCFCLIALCERVPDESTIRKLTRRLGPDVVAKITRAVIAKATRERRFVARAARIDSTVVEADIRSDGTLHPLSIPARLRRITHGELPHFRSPRMRASGPAPSSRPLRTRSDRLRAQCSGSRSPRRSGSQPVVRQGAWWSSEAGA